MIIVIGNPIMSSAESLSVIKEYNTLEEAQKEMQDSILEPTETIGGVWYSFKAETPYRNFNRSLQTDNKLKKLCENNFGGWSMHGGDCSGSVKPDKYACFNSPCYIEQP